MRDAVRDQLGHEEYDLVQHRMRTPQHLTHERPSPRHRLRDPDQLGHSEKVPRRVTYVRYLRSVGTTRALAGLLRG
ncbi:hypothetical protein AB0B89_11820 [Sphaerisporangium sp. NPDC049002]|uniref:hypothetical protein n=1 Tax=Sphaerisporangium sp. NPDC049002 TaxID=3155392 RepID=UPI0034032D21